MTRIVLLACMLVLGACTQGRVAFDAAEQARATVVGYDGIRVWGDAGLDEFERNRMLPGKSPNGRLAILAISGGGSGGAFAAGLLSGWTKQGSRPRFDVVTGVSTGALIAPFAFLGPQFDEQLAHIYTSGLASSLMKPKFAAAGLFGSGLFDAESLRDLVKTYANSGLIEVIAAEHRKGRRLFVVTTNLDAQRPVVWNMGAIAASGAPGALTLFQDVLVASSSIPAVYAPVLIKAATDARQFEELHSDGASSMQVFTLPDALLLAAKKPAGLPSAKADLCVIVNNALIPEFDLTANSTFSVAGRALATVVKSQTKGSVIATYGFARRAGMGFRIAAIDRAVPYDGRDPFNTGYMRTLFKLGYEGAVAGTAWKDRPSFTSAAN